MAALPDGVHLSLPSDDYFAQDALGSTDIIALHKHRHGWWWSSRHNPDRVERVSPARTYGTALHAILLEGVDAYEARFAAQPQRVAGVIDTEEEIKAALVAAGLSLRQTSGWRKPDWLRAMRQNLPREKVWSNMLADFRRDIGDRQEISAVEDRMLRFMADVAVDPERTDNLEVRQLFAGDGGFPALAEVSVFATVGGIRRRWRIDRMFPRFDMDLKSLGNWTGRPLPWAVGDIIARSGYDIQRADYLDGRAAAYRAIAEGRVFGGTAEARRWLARFPGEFPRWDWVWLFYQKPLATGRAPVIFPVWDSTWELRPGQEPTYGPLVTYGLQKKRAALDFYRQEVAAVGLERPWARVEETHYTDPHMPNPIFLPAWIADEAPTVEGAYSQEEREPDA